MFDPPEGGRRWFMSLRAEFQFLRRIGLNLSGTWANQHRLVQSCGKKTQDVLVPNLQKSDMSHLCRLCRPGIGSMARPLADQPGL